MPYRDWNAPIPPCPECGCADPQPVAVEAFAGTTFVSVKCDRCGGEFEVSMFTWFEPNVERVFQSVPRKK